MASRITADEFAELYAQYTLVSRNMQKLFSGANQLSSAQYFILRILSDKRQLRMGDISNMMSISRPNLTPLVDKLVTKGYVRRQTHEQDRRVTFITITTKGQQAYESEDRAFCACCGKRLASLCDDDLELLSRALRTLTEVVPRI